MKRILISLAIGFVLLCGSPAYSAVIDADIAIDGNSFLQAFTVTNNSTGGLNITRVVYSLGTAADGIAAWDYNTGGGAASDFLSNPEWFQTVTWTGLSIAPGAALSFSGLDIDYIETLSPLSVTGSYIDDFGSSLRNAFFGIEYNDGFGLRTVELNETGWTVCQNLSIEGSSTLPEPATMLLLGLGLVGLAGIRRK
ncbi:MAG: PEP-CTERM sorting domain-containing protein [Syntrophaceae bacterium]